MYFLLSYFKRILTIKDPQPSQFNESISVIICAKNELENLKKNLPSILSQQYESFEIIVVNDGSTDGSEEFLMKLESEFANFRFLTLDPENKQFEGKKEALQLGIESTKNEYLVMTDADCRPNSDLWIQQFADCYSQGFDLIIGFSPLTRTSGITNLLTRLDTFWVALQYLSFSAVNKTYMGVGRNIGYRKSLFVKAGKFKNHLGISSGDDDLFVQDAIKIAKVKTLISSDSIVQSSAPKTIASWIKQKSRHLTTSSSYNNKTITTLSLLNLATFFYPILLISNLILNKFMLVVFILAIVKLAIQGYIYARINRRLQQGTEIILSTIFANLMVGINIFVVILNQIRRNNKW